MKNALLVLLVLGCGAAGIAFAGGSLGLFGKNTLLGWQLGLGGIASFGILCLLDKEAWKIGLAVGFLCWLLTHALS